MDLDGFFTEIDKDITGTSEPDPMGLLPVWTGFAGNLFRNRVNSRVNDLRTRPSTATRSWPAPVGSA